MRLNKQCKHVGCMELTTETYCSKHKPKRPSTSNWSSMYNNRKWREYSRRYLVANTYCVECGAIATDVDHIKPHRGDVALFWKENNHQALCHSCHSRKTMRETNSPPPSNC